MGRHRIVATSQDGYKTGAFKFSVRVTYRFRGNLPKGLPPWFRDLDKDEDGQIALHEWRNGGKKPTEFREIDLNDDGYITAEEFARHLQKRHELRLQNGRLNCEDVIEEAPEERYRGKKSFKIYTVHLEAGKSYQFEHISKVFQAFLYLEDADGNVVRKHSSPTIGGLSRIVYRPVRSGVYRVVATSLGGFRVGPFSCSIRAMNPAFGENMPKGLPEWFSKLDTDADNQISFAEWRKGNMNVDEFRMLDLNDDGFITAEEILRFIRKFPKLKR